MEATRKTVIKSNDGGGVVWFLGAVGAAVYFIQTAESFIDGAFGILKALVWPALLAYHYLIALGI